MSFAKPVKVTNVPQEGMSDADFRKVIDGLKKHLDDGTVQDESTPAGPNDILDDSVFDIGPESFPPFPPDKHGNCHNP